MTSVLLTKYRTKIKVCYLLGYTHKHRPLNMSEVLSQQLLFQQQKRLRDGRVDIADSRSGTVHEIFTAIPTYEFETIYQHRVRRWRKCVVHAGEYFEEKKAVNNQIMQRVNAWVATDVTSRKWVGCRLVSLTRGP